MTEDEIAGWHHQLDGHEFGWLDKWVCLLFALISLNSSCGKSCLHFLEQRLTTRPGVILF